MCQALDEALANRIGHVYEDDGNGARCQLRGSKPRGALGHNQVWGQPNQFRSVCALAVGIGGSRAMIYVDIVTCSPSQLMKLLCKRLSVYGVLRIGFGNDPQYPNSPHPFGLLRTRSEGALPRSVMNSRRRIWPLETCFVICRV